MLNKIQEKQEEQEYKDVEARAALARPKKTDDDETSKVCTSKYFCHKWG